MAYEPLDQTEIISTASTVSLLVTAGLADLLIHKGLISKDEVAIVIRHLLDQYPPGRTATGDMARQMLGELLKRFDGTETQKFVG